MPAAPAPSGSHWGVIVGTAIVLVLIAAGLYVFFTYGGYSAFLMPTEQTKETPQPQTTEDSLNALDAELSASAAASSSGDVDNLENSL
jgi:hypothetical protein